MLLRLKLSLIPSNTGGLSQWCGKIDFMKDCNVDVKIIDCMVTKNCCLCNMQLKCERGRHYLKNSLFVLRWLDSLLKIMSIPFTLWRKLNINIVILNKLYLKTYINPVTVNVFEGWDSLSIIQVHSIYIFKSMPMYSKMAPKNEYLSNLHHPLNNGKLSHTIL